MAYRDDFERLQARIEHLETELAGAKRREADYRALATEQFAEAKVRLEADRDHGWRSRLSGHAAIGAGAMLGFLVFPVFLWLACVLIF